MSLKPLPYKCPLYIQIYIRLYEFYRKHFSLILKIPPQNYSEGVCKPPRLRDVHFRLRRK